MHALVHAADVQDRDGGALVMATLFGSFPFLLKLYADGGYQGPEFRQAVDKVIAGVNVEIVKRSDQAKGFVVLPRRWVVERTFAWLGRCRRLAKDWEALNHKARATRRQNSWRICPRSSFSTERPSRRRGGSSVPVTSFLISLRTASGSASLSRSG